MSPIPDGQRTSQTVSTETSDSIRPYETITEQFADERLRLERLKVVYVFARSDEDDGTPGRRHADKQQKKKSVKASGALRQDATGDTYALRAPPPLACPSSLVTITDATSTLSLKALA